ncbi:hypothetical protein [Aquisalimonas asiatica]|uniref:Uncharacterized protein n=1 Tax=Aquisalimonas asiatica TaxID=406100 RepID=A0A1H8S6T4_9GAMM|nr:hypothetical protein [Aquisalimonas asiatica]SEO73863.1 hypothetical protein SAMN04488052_102508 [Aquisalimonas asiatica]
MQPQPANAITGRTKPGTVRSWLRLLLILLTLLPATLVLAAPAPVHLAASNSVPETPVCDHAEHHAQAPAAVNDNRGRQLPPTGDGDPPRPHPGALLSLLPPAQAMAAEAPAPQALPPVAVYLLTQRLRV